MNGAEQDMQRDRTHRPRRILTVALAAAFCTAARADGFSLLLNPGYTGSRITAIDETGHESKIDSSVVSQKYRLSLDKSFYPTLTLSAGGSLDWSMASTRSEGLTRDFDSKQWNGFARLRAGSSLLSWALDYDHQEQDVTSSGTGLLDSSSALLRDSYGGSASWHPFDLPSLDLRLTRADTHDRARRSTDQTSEEALVATRYEPTKNLELRYSIRAGWLTDHLNDVRTSQLTNSAAGTWSDTYLAGRGTAYVSYSVGAINSRVNASGAGGTFSTPQLPVAGLSVVEVFPDLPSRVPLAPNSALVDGATGVSAGLNLGYSGSTQTGERPFRDIGAQFANATTPVNAVYVYVDRTLPADVAAGFTWTAYQSDNNLDWITIGGSSTARFDPLLNRFEIPIQRTAARYLKVVTRPLPTNVTTPQYSEIFITELQFYLVVPAQEAERRSSSLGGSLNATNKIQLIGSSLTSLAYDVSAIFTHSSSSQRVTYDITNGLSANRRLGRAVAVSGRIERGDADQGIAHEGRNRWSATLSLDPIPTFGCALIYTGQLNQLRTGDSISQTFSGAARVDLYQGISTSANATYGFGRTDIGRDTRVASVSGNMTLTPNRVLSLAGSIGFTDSAQTGAGQADQSDQRGLVEGSAAFTPFQALVLSAAVTRIFGASVTPQTLASFAAAFSPFQGGDLQFTYSYQETLDTSGEQRTRTHGPAARWRIRRGWFVEGGYSFSDSSTPAQDVSTQFFFANLSIALQ